MVRYNNWKRRLLFVHYPFILAHKVIWRDLDALGHVNNAVYATYFETGRLEYMAQLTEHKSEMPSMIMAEVTITYKSPAFLREVLLIGVRVAEVRNSSFVIDSQITEQTSGRLVATSRAVLVFYDYERNLAVRIPEVWRERFAKEQVLPA
jgi:acyl-CoA thioester hydrolase